MATLQVRLLGELGAEVDGIAITLPTSRRACALLAWLALRPGQHSRSRLAALLWPDVLDASARASLRSALWALRAAFGPTAGEYLHAGRDHVELAGNGLIVDVRELDRLLAAGCPQEAVALHRGDLLAQFDADWVLDARDEHRERLCGAYAALAVAAEGDGQVRTARDWAAKRVAAMPLDEQAARELIRLLVADGDQAGAVAAYQRFAARLGAELGISPAAETKRLVSALREGPPGAASPGAFPAVFPATPATSTAGAVNGPGRLVGRDGEVRALLRHWQASRAGSGTAVAISGDGGMGKTRLAREILDAANADGALTAIAAAGGPGAAAPFALWSELLDDLIAQAGPLPKPPPHGDADWDTLLTAIRTGARAPATEPRLDRIRFFEATVALLSWAARDRPLALVLEDLHAADRSSLELVAYAGRRITRLPVLFVLTRRRLPPRSELDAVLAALRARGTLAAEFDLGPLPAAALDKLVGLTVRIPASQRERIVRLAAGNPLLAVETARYAAPDADPAAGLAGATRQAIARLSPAARLFTELAAVAGRDLDRAEVASLPLLDNPSGAAAEALGSGLLHSTAERTGFRHVLLGEAVYHDLPDPVRARLHETLATWLREREPRGTAVRPSPARNAAEIARHFRLAGQADLAADQLVRAAAAARMVAALPEAAAYLTEAASLAGQAGAGPDPELFIELADVQAWRGMLPESDEAFGRALELIAADDHDALAAAWLRRGHWLRGGICHPRESLRSYRAALDCCDRSGGADPLILTESLAGMAWAEATAGDAAEADDLLVKAERLLNEVAGASAARVSQLRHDIDTARAHALLRAGRFTESYGPLIAASAAAGRAGRPDLAYSCLVNAASAAACAGDLPLALDYADRCLPLVVPTGLLRPCVYTHSARTALLRLLGRLGEARVACDAAAAAAERIGLPELEGLVHHDRGLLATAAGEHKTAAIELGLALDLGAPVSRPRARLLRAEALARDGRPDDAEAELRGVALEPVSPADSPDTLVARMSHVQGLIALQRGNRSLAARRLREAESGWLRRSRPEHAEHDTDSGQHYVAALIDLGRPPVAELIEPARELAALRADIATLNDLGGSDA
jgi:DNA-binding SARP family transcriptional activator/tetratricopeptide (TPR) repeat protein